MLSGGYAPQQTSTNMLPASYSCPRCKCNALYRTHRKGCLDWLMSAIGLRPARCFTCNKRFYIRWSKISGSSDARAPKLREDCAKTRLTAYPD
jgi:hypothetical protein